MNFIFEIFPVFLFFIVFKFYDIYAATLVGIIATYIQVVSYRFYKGHWSKQQVITLFGFLLFGGMTLYFHDPLFIKWKPTVVFWLFSIIILATQWFARKPLMQRMMENMLDGKATVPECIWRRVNVTWGLFFLVMGMLNLYVAYNFDNDVWVNFKFYGITSALILSSVIQALYLSKYMTDVKSS